MADVTPAILIIAILGIATGAFLFLYSYSSLFAASVNEYNVADKGITIISSASNMIDDCINSYLLNSSNTCIVFKRLDFSSSISISVNPAIPSPNSYVRFEYNDATYLAPETSIIEGTMIGSFGLYTVETLLFDPRYGPGLRDAVTGSSIGIVVGVSPLPCDVLTDPAYIQWLYEQSVAEVGEIPVFVAFVCTP